MPIRLLLVDDSPTARQLLAHIISSAPDMTIVGQAANGVQAVQMVEQLSPDLVLMDVTMPQMDGLEATREIMHRKPTPIVIISATVNTNETSIAFEAISAGALQVLRKPGGPMSSDYNASVKELLGALRAMAGVHVIRHVRSARLPIQTGTPQPRPSTANAQPEIVAIASSTGGPQTLAEIIKNLPPTFSLPVVIVQHITPEFVTPLVEWLSTVTKLPVRVAVSGEHPVQGTIYFAPGRQHLQLTRDHRFGFTDVPANVPHIPSGDVLLESVAQHYGACAVGIVLTGMGSDGARGLRSMHNAGALTIAQDEASCVVFGMPKEAAALGAARHILPPSEIAKLLNQFTV